MEPSDIPSVDFIKKGGRELEYEILRLEGLLAGRNRLPFRLDHPHRVQFHHVMYITAGQGVHHIDFQPVPFGPGSLLFVAQGQVHEFEVRPDRSGYVVLFTADYLKQNMIHSEVISLYRLYNYHLHSPVLNPGETEGQNFHGLFQEMMSEFANPDPFAKAEILRLLLKLLLVKVERVKRTILADRVNANWAAMFHQFKRRLEGHYQATRSVKEYARMLNLSPKHLNTICRSVSGETAKQVIDEFVVLQIKRVLATSNDSIQEISFALGFDEPTNFVKFFKKRAGQSPVQFRKSFTR